MNFNAFCKTIFLLTLFSYSTSNPVVSSRSSRSALKELGDLIRAVKQEESDREFYNRRRSEDTHQETKEGHEGQHERSKGMKKEDLPPDCSTEASGQEVCLMNSAGEVSIEENCIFAHNKVREFHGVPALTWSASLTETSREWAKHLCDIGYMEHTSGADYGENLYWWSGSYDAKQTCGNAVYDWYSECVKPMGQERLYDYSADENPGSLHFTQLIWKETTEVGCGICKVGEVNYYVVCQYLPKGNWMGDFVANIPEPTPPVVYGTEQLDSAYDLEVSGQCFNKFDGCDASSCNGMFSEYYRPFCGKECNEGC